MKYFELYEKYKRSLYFFFDTEKSGISGFEFCNGNKINFEGTLYYNVEKLDIYINDYDYLPVSSGPPLISQKFRDVFKDIENVQIEYFPTEILDKKGNINTNYFAMNILNILECLDKEKSIFEINEYGSYEIKKMYLISNSLENFQIIRLKEDQLKIIVDEEFIKICKYSKLKGMDYLEEGYSIYSNL